MGYSINPQVIADRMYLLEDLNAGNAAAWIITPPDGYEARRRAYAIREALYIAKTRAPEDYPNLAAAYDRFEIVVVNDGLVEAKPRATSHVQGAEVPTVHKSTAAEVIASWQARQPSNDKLSFQQPRLSLEELTKLYEWCIAHEPALMMMVGKDNLTVAPLEAGNTYYWKPPEPPKKAERIYDI